MLRATVVALVAGAWRGVQSLEPRPPAEPARRRTRLAYARALGAEAEVSAEAPGRLGSAARGTAAPGRRLSDFAEQIWEPIRIHLDTSELERDLPNETARADFLDVLQAAARWISTTVRVRPVLGRLSFEKPCLENEWSECREVLPDYRSCGEGNIPKEHFRDTRACFTGLEIFCEVSEGGAGIPNADFALYVTHRPSAPSCCGLSAQSGTNCTGMPMTAVAYASFCLQDQHDRPVAGHINWCTKPSTATWHSNLATAVHEMMHVMGFNSGLFPFFRDDGGSPRTPRDQWNLPPLHPTAGRYEADPGTIEVVERKGETRHFVALPRVVEAAREHFACPTLEHVPLEEAGGEGAAFSHWDDRYFQSEIMSPDAFEWPILSTMTLALLEDSGWYKPDYSRAGPFTFGKGKGCDFLTRPCIEAGETKFPDTFCTDAGGQCPSTAALGCSRDLLATAYCSNCLHAAALPEGMRWFDDPRLGGSGPYMNHCPYWRSWNHCREEGSLCVTGTSGSSFPVFCTKVQCDSSSLRVLVQDTLWIECAADEGGVSKPVGASGSVVCPDHGLACGGSRLNNPAFELAPSCIFPGVLRQGVCACAPGFIGDDCTAEDRKAQRSLFPFGLAYRQASLPLEKGQQVDNAKLTTWPLRPEVQGPPGLVYSISPPLPSGLEFDPSTGEITGTPAAAVAPGAYVVKASRGRFAATTSVLLSVACPAGDANCEQAVPEAPSRFPEAAPDGEEGEAISHDAAAEHDSLRLFLWPSFSAIQAEPGLYVFSLKFKFAIAAAAGLAKPEEEVVVNFISALAGRSWVDFSFTSEAGERLGEEELEGAISRLVDSLDDNGSGLRTSFFGRRYLRDAELLQRAPDGLLLRWPAAEDHEPFWRRKLEEHAAIIGVVVTACCLSCLCRQCWKRRRRRARKSEPLRETDASADAQQVVVTGIPATGPASMGTTFGRPADLRTTSHGPAL